MPALYLLKRGLTSFRSAHENLITFNSPDTTGRITIVDSRMLHIDHIREYTLRLECEVKTKMDNLLFHDPIFTIPNDEFIHDDPRSRDPGYGFVNDVRNSWHDKPTVLQYILTNHDRLSMFAYHDEKGQFHWKPGAVHTRMIAIYDLQMDLFVLILLSFGAPARGTELLSNLILNIAGGSIRNVFSLFNLFTLRGTFNKTSHATLQHRAMVRIPLVSVGRLFIRFLVFLRPLYSEWQYVFRPNMHSNSTHFLFAGLYRPVVTSDLSLKLSTVFWKEYKVKMSLGRFRQWMAFLFSCNRPIFRAVDSGTTSTSDQFGHSEEMDMDHYGADLRFPQGLNNSIYMETARASAATQLMFGHPPDLLLALSQGADWQNGIVTLSKAIMEGRYVPPNQAIIPQSSGILTSPDLAISAHSIANVIKTDVLPEFSLHINRAIAESYGSVLSILAPKQHRPQPGSLQQNIRVHTHPFLLERLRHFRSTEDSLPGFTGAAQAEVTQLMFDGQSNIGYFAATGEYLTTLRCRIALSDLSLGSGKTTPALLNATLDQGKSTVWCLPLKSMHEQYHLRCKSHSMTCETWTRLTSPDHPPSHILVTIELTDSHRFHDFMSRLVAARKVARAVVDEAHFALTHDSFRSIMRTLAWLGSVNCQIVLLSATVGPSLVEALFETFGITHYVVCREKTTRPNISYNVIRSPNPHQTLDNLVRKCLVRPGCEKAIVYCRSREETESTANRLHLPFCHGSMPLSEINAVLDLLRAGQARAVVSTTVLGAALDLCDLRWVFHLDHPYDMISYIQESGRVGRNPDMPAFSYVIIPQHSTPRYPTPDRFGAKLIYDWASDSKSCRRWLMHLFNDGVAQPCSMMERVSHLCDVCRTAQSIRPDRGIHNTPSADVIRRYIPPTHRQ
jgi:hypothetical protein